MTDIQSATTDSVAVGINKRKTAEPTGLESFGVAGKEKIITIRTVSTYKTNLSGKIKVEGKDDMKKRGVKSPNLADALVLSFHLPAQMPMNREKFKRKRLVT